MIKLKIDALSVNRCWQGKRFKTSDYKDYEQELFYRLPKNMVIPKGKLELRIVWGMSNKLKDIDNCCKPFIDILQKMYSFNDRNIYSLILKKVDTKKGEEFIEFQISAI